MMDQARSAITAIAQKLSAIESVTTEYELGRVAGLVEVAVSCSSSETERKELVDVLSKVRNRIEPQLNGSLTVIAMITKNLEELNANSIAAPITYRGARGGYRGRGQTAYTQSCPI